MKPVLLVLVFLSEEHRAWVGEKFDMIYAPNEQQGKDRTNGDAQIAARGHEISVVLTNGVNGLLTSEIDRLPALKLICTLGVGYENVAVAHAKARGILVTDLIGGVIDFTVADMVNGLQQSRAGRVTALGVTSKTRSPLAPDIPTLAEAGLPGYDLTVWFGVAAPAGTPPDVVAHINTALGNVLQTPALQRQFENNGLSVRASSAAEFGQVIASDIDKWGKVFVAAGLTPQ